MFVINYFIFVILTCSVGSVYSLSNTSADEVPDRFANLTAGNDLWSSLLSNCKSPSLSCVRNNIYEYLKDILDHANDIEVTNFLKFSKNSVDHRKLSTMFEEPVNQTEDSTLLLEDETPLEEISRSLYDNAVKFLMSHDLEIQLPEFYFSRTVVKLSPRAFEDEGALVKLEILPKAVKNSVGEGRLFKKIRKFITQRLLYALLAILLVIKLLAVKVLFILPTIVGVAAAKKLLIKVLLFLFPALHHLFKFCAYVPYGAKHHIHKHQIAHIHEVSHGHHHHGPHFKPHEEVISPHVEGPPPLSHYPGYKDEGYEGFESSYPSGPYYGNEIIDHRNDPIQQEEELNFWGQGQTKRPNKPASGRPLTPSEIEYMVLKAEKEALIKARLQKEKRRIHEENLRLQEQLNNALKIQGKLKQKTAAIINAKVPQKMIPEKPIPHHKAVPSQFLQTPSVDGPYASGLVDINPLRAEASFGQLTTQYSPQSGAQNRQEVYPVQQINQQQDKSVNFAKTPEPQQFNFDYGIYKSVAITYDQFYSPILDKIDKIFQAIGFSEEPCRERLICSMYKNPSKFSPHSNLLSAELSRDAKDLEKPTLTNTAVIRFYRYVQAARDGQDKRDCIRLYPACAIDTES